MRPRVLLADNHPAVLRAATALLKPRFEIVGSTTDGASLVSLALRVYPDVIVTEYYTASFERNRCRLSTARVLLASENCVSDNPL